LKAGEYLGNTFWNLFQSPDDSIELAFSTVLLALGLLLFILRLLYKFVITVVEAGSPREANRSRDSVLDKAFLPVITPLVGGLERVWPLTGEMSGASLLMIVGKSTTDADAVGPGLSGRSSPGTSGITSPLNLVMHFRLCSIKLETGLGLVVGGVTLLLLLL
jgi:hypothetical protein